MASPLADFVVSLGTDGHIADQGSVSDVIAQNSKLAEEVEREEETIEQDEEESSERNNIATDTSGKLVLAEEIEEGHVSTDACEYPVEMSWHQYG